METGATKPSQLQLRWDGSEVQWASLHTEEEKGEVHSFGSREIRKISMLPEVIRFLHGRYKDVDRIFYARRFSQSTMVPSVVIEGNIEIAQKWYNLHNAPSELSKVRLSHLESVDTEPVMVEGLDDEWEAAVTESFPQARALSQSAILMNLATASSRLEKGKWVVYVDAGKKGADIVSAKDGAACYAGATQSGLSDSMLYNIVNAMHRDGLKPDEVIVFICGEEGAGLVDSMKRFFEDIRVLGGEESAYFSLKSLAL
jgi:hypothetical protein